MGTAPAQGLPSNNSCCPLALALWSICRAQHRSSGPPQCPLTHESFADEEKRVQDLNWGPAPGPHAARLRGAGLASRPGPFSMLTSPPGLGCTEACPCTWANARRPVPAHFCYKNHAKLCSISQRRSPRQADPRPGSSEPRAPGSTALGAGQSAGEESRTLLPLPTLAPEVEVKIAQSLFARKP